MKKSLLLILCLLTFMGCAGGQTSFQVCQNTNCWNVSIADDPEEMQTGLMYKTSLAENAGMLFIFPEPDLYEFWMQNTYIPLDIIWLDQNKQIVFIKENAAPCNTNTSCLKIKPAAKASYVLELNAGQVKKQGLKIGDNFTW